MNRCSSPVLKYYRMTFAFIKILWRYLFRGIINMCNQFLWPNAEDLSNMVPLTANTLYPYTVNVCSVYCLSGTSIRRFGTNIVISHDENCRGHEYLNVAEIYDGQMLQACNLTNRMTLTFVIVRSDILCLRPWSTYPQHFVKVIMIIR